MPSPAQNVKPSVTYNLIGLTSSDLPCIIFCPPTQVESSIPLEPASKVYERLYSVYQIKCLAHLLGLESVPNRLSPTPRVIDQP